MKKILTHLTGIVFLITILLAGACNQQDQPMEKGPKKVIITLKAVKINGEKHLEMYDSNNPDNIVIDKLETLVYPGDTVVWQIISGWKLKKVERIGPVNPGKIIVKDADQVPDSKALILVIPKDAPWDTIEKYDIKCKGWISKWEIDPYLKLPKEQQE